MLFMVAYTFYKRIVDARDEKKKNAERRKSVRWVDEIEEKG